jgi:transposase InsO family protein
MSTATASTAQAEKLARHRLSILELALTLDSVSEACRQHGVSRTQFYEYKRRFQEQGLDGLKDLPPIHKTHPQTTPPEVVARVLALSLERPGWGCGKLADDLKLQGISVSGPTIQGLLNKEGLGIKYERLLRLEEQALEEGVEMTPEQVALVEQANPCYRERQVESSRPGELLCQNTYFVGVFKGVGKVYLPTVVDTYGSYAFGFLSTGRGPEAAVTVLRNDVLPFYQDRGIAVEAVLTDNGRAFCGTNTHPYEQYLALNNIAHRPTTVRHPQTNGFIERFHRTALDEFFRKALRACSYESLDALQADFDGWLHHYNEVRPHRGYRNLGTRPIDTINHYIAAVNREA